MLSTLITKLELGMRLRIMQFHAENRNRMCAYIFNKRIIRILIYMRICVLLACLFRNAYVSAYTNKSKHLHLKTDFGVSDCHLT